jgi:transposase
MTLSCSRHSYEEALWGQDRTHFLRAHEHAFQSFAGVPTTVVLGCQTTGFPS